MTSRRAGSLEVDVQGKSRAVFGCGHSHVDAALDDLPVVCAGTLAGVDDVPDVET